MAQPILPPELHHSIIDVIGDDVVYAELVLHSVKGSARETLRACSLVCKAWHDSALGYTFHNARFSMVVGDRMLKRNAELFRLLEANPSIRRCIRRAEMYLESEVSPEDVEKVCNAISPVDEFSLVLPLCTPDHPRPLLDGLRPILSSRHLRDLSISSLYFPLCLLEDVPNLHSLSLPRVDTVHMDHGRDGSWRSSTLEKLVVSHARRFLNAVQPLADENVGLLAFFDRLKYLEMDLSTNEVSRNNSWAALLAHWRRLETLVLHWNLLGESVSIRYLMLLLMQSSKPFTDSVQFLELLQKLPWESFQALRSLTYDIYYRKTPPKHLFNTEVDASALIFTGPSRLPQLEDLHVTYHNRTALYEREDLDSSLDAIYLHNLNRTIEDPRSFPSLRSFHTKVHCEVSIHGSLVLDEEKLVESVVDRLPAIFRVGGRRDSYGLVTSIVPIVGVDLDDY